jgi:hypothetical protein
MANLVWTAILYISTVGIVLVCYRAFVFDRKVERERSTSAMIAKAYQKVPGKAPALPATGKLQIPGVKTQAPPPWAAKARRA